MFARSALKTKGPTYLLISGFSCSNEGCAMIVSAYKDIAGADICMYATVAEIFSFNTTRIKLMGKKKKFKDNDIAIKK